MLCGKRSLCMCFVGNDVGELIESLVKVVATTKIKVS